MAAYARNLFRAVRVAIALVCCARLLVSYRIQSSHRAAHRLYAVTGDWDLKKLPSDFIVIEDAVLDYIEQPVLEVQPATEGDTVSAERSRDDYENELQGFLCEDVLREMEEYALQCRDTPSKLPHYAIRVDKKLDKEERKAIHRCLKALYDDFESRTDMENSDESITAINLYKVGPKKSQSGGNNRRWDRSQPDYLHFTVIKKMMSTSEMIEKVAKSTGMLPSRFAFAGTKDKRAVTLQRVSVWRADQQLMQKPDLRSVVIRDIYPKPQPVSMGEHSGNFFVVTLRKTLETSSSEGAQESVCDDGPMLEDAGSEMTVRDIMKTLKLMGSRSYLNSFGPQRFGSPLPLNAAVGKVIMKGDFRLAVMMLIMQPQSTEEVARGLDSNALENVLAMPSNQHASYFSILTERWQDLLNTDGEYVEANDSNDGDRNLPERYLHRRQAVLQFLHGNTRKPKRSDLIPQIPRQLMQACAKEVDTVRRIITKSRRLEGSGRSAEDLSLDELNIDFQRIFSALPINIRHLYVNAYQSQLWNDMASEREAKAKRAPHAQEGELVLVDANKAPLTIWDVGPQNISLTANQIPLWSDDFLDDLSVDAKAYVHIVNAVEALTATYSLEALILPLPGHSTVIPAKMMKTLTSDDMGALIRGDHENTMYRLPGAYRHVFASARNVRTKLNVRKEGASPDSGDCGMDKERSSAYSHECDYSDARSGWVDLTGLPKNEKSEVSKGESEEGDDDDVSVVCDTLSTLAPAREPMHLRVERLWQEGSIQKLLNDIYAQPNLFDLDASLKESDRYIASTSEESAKVPRPRTKVPKASNASSLTVAFSLCSSGYATNYIDWILEETEKRLRRSKKAAKAKGKVSKTI